MAALLSTEEKSAALVSLDGWVLARDGDAIARTFKFDDFVAAFGFMARAALIAEKMDHHPEWANVYNRVDVTLSTHSAGGLTTLDIELARALDRIALS